MTNEMSDQTPQETNQQRLLLHDPYRLSANAAPDGRVLWRVPGKDGWRPCALAGAPQTPHPMVGYFGVYPARMAGALAPLREPRKRQIGEKGPCGTPANVKLGKMALAGALQTSNRGK